MNNREINMVVAQRNRARILMNLFEQDEREVAQLDGFNIRNSEQQERFVNAISDCDSEIRLWFGMHWEDDDFETWRGFNRCFGVVRTEITQLRRQGIVTDTTIDDGTLHITLSRDRVAQAINVAFTDEDVDEIINEQQSIANEANRIIDGLQG